MKDKDQEDRAQELEELTDRLFDTRTPPLDLEARKAFLRRQQAELLREAGLPAQREEE